MPPINTLLNFNCHQQIYKIVAIDDVYFCLDICMFNKFLFYFYCLYCATFLLCIYLRSLCGWKSKGKRKQNVTTYCVLSFDGKCFMDLSANNIGLQQCRVSPVPFYILHSVDDMEVGCMCCLSLSWLW